MRRARLAISAALLLGGPPLPLPGADLFVAPAGDDRAPGTRERPLRTLDAAREAARRRRGSGARSITIWLRGGRYRLERPLELSREDSGSADSPFVIRSVEGEEAVLDGGAAIDPETFHPVTDRGLLERLAPAARGRVWAADLGAIGRAGLFEGSPLGPQISFEGEMLRLARWPDRGYAHIAKVHETGAVYAHGRTKGPPPRSSMEHPIGAVFSARERFSPLLEAEFERTRELFVQGFLAYDWYKTTDAVARVEGGRIRLLGSYRYPIGKTYEKIPRRFRLLDALCELDGPGQWYFDRAEGRLYLWPPSPIGKGTVISVWGAPGLVRIENASRIVVRGLTLESSRGEPIVIRGGSENLVAGCAIRNCGGGVRIAGGERNGVTGCDIFDVGGSHITLEGGVASAREIRPAGNFATNNHLAQSANDGERGVRIRGVGNLFRHNLIHDFLGQAIVYSGNDHRIEYNEIYNVGIEEGDGGASYCGAQLWSYGNVLRYNFYHHLMCLPEAHPRAGLYLDDLDAGDTVRGNVFYKAAHRAVLINGGAANVVEGNLFVRCFIGIYNTSANARKARELAPRYQSGELRRGDKMDYLWRAEQVVGKRGWLRPPWSERYPLFAKVMEEDPYWPLECRFEGNLFSECAHDFQFRTGWGASDVIDIHEARGLRVERNRDVDLSLFEDPEALDFRLRKGVRPPPGFEPIPFEKIGLYLDEYRRSAPDKKAYRSRVRARFEGRPSYDPEARYDPDRINDLLYPAREAAVR